MDKKRFSYIINLTKRQLTLAVFILVLNLGLIFFLGYVIGVISSNEGTSIENDITSNSRDENPLNNESEIIFDDNLTSSDLLRLDNGSPSRKTTLREAQQNQVKRENTSTKQVKRKSPARPTSNKANSNVSGGKFYLQVIATSSKEKANRIKRQFAKRKYPVFITTEKRNNAELYLVRVGFFKSKENALKHLKIIRTKSPYKETFIKKI